MTTPSTDYHDYVFRDNRLVGDFEGMYRHSRDIPWHQDRMAYDLCADIDIAILGKRSHKRICDIGAGLGYFSDRLRRELVSPDGERPKVVGLEISPTATQEANARFPDIRFVVSDILSDAWTPPQDSFDLIVARDILWYVCQEIDRFFDRLCMLSEAIREDRFIHISQSFPACEKWVGQDVIDSPERLFSHIERVADVVYSCIERDITWNGGIACHAFARVRPVTLGGLS